MTGDKESAGVGAGAAQGAVTTVAFGSAMRQRHFLFAQGYLPINHGSFGAFPSTVLEYQRQLQLECEKRPDTFIRYTYPPLLKTARAAASQLLGVNTDEVVFLPNATSCFNTILRNLNFEENDVIIHFNTIYPACLNTIEAIGESSPVRRRQIDITYPIEDDAILDAFATSVREIKSEGKTPKLALFDTVLTWPGIGFPWERLVTACRDLNILSCIDGAHGVGHIDLTHLGGVSPDFFFSNCYKWLMVPRGCAILHVPFRNQHLIRTTIPTSGGYLAPDRRRNVSTQDYFVKMFEKISTTDNTPYLCVPKALEFREQVCGGEANVRDYCRNIARHGGQVMARKLGTEVLEVQSAAAQNCCFAQVRLPLAREELDMTEAQAAKLARQITEQTAAEFETYIPTKYYAGGFWSRVSGQIYLEMDDFERAAEILLELCNRTRRDVGVIADDV